MNAFRSQAYWLRQSSLQPCSSWLRCCCSADASADTRHNKLKSAAQYTVQLELTDATVLLELAKMHKEGIVDQDFNNPQVLLTFC
jgi:hypothetical protein